MSEYITIDELKELGCMPPEDIDNAEAQFPGMVAARIRTASNKADAYLRKRHKPPMAVASDALKQLVADITVYHLFVARGFNPDSGTDSLIVQLKDEAFTFLEKVSKGELEMDPWMDQTPNLDEHGPLAGNSGNNPYAWLYKNGYGKYGKKYPYGGCCGC